MQLLTNKSKMRKSGRGFTLLEVVVSMAILSVVALGSLYTSGNLVRLNRLTVMEIAAANAVSAEMFRIERIAHNSLNVEGAGFSETAAEGLIYYLRRKAGELGGEAADVVQFTRIDLENGILRCEFPVATPGLVKMGSITISGANADNPQRYYGVGIMNIYLREVDVPPEFYAWSTLVNGGGTPNTGSPTHFSMDDDDSSNSDYTALFTRGTNTGSSLLTLPIEFEVRYYNSADVLQSDRSLTGVGFAGDNSLINVQRRFLLAG